MGPDRPLLFAWPVEEGVILTLKGVRARGGRLDVMIRWGQLAGFMKRVEKLLEQRKEG